jgi:Arc/MetJ-type ribon-helix-helix transcriptional regulator
MTAKERLTVTLPGDAAATLREMADAGRIESVSAYVSAAVTERLEREERALHRIEQWAAAAERRDPEAWARAMADAERAARRDEAPGVAA